jgi:hypothetical protein
VNLPTRRLDELTSREVEFWMREGGDLALIPFGPSSGHGALISLGIHAHWAHALALLIAERANGLVYPPVYTVYSGATRTFRGAVSFSITDQVDILVRLAKKLYKQGFKRTVLVAGTTPENFGGMVAARELFDTMEVPFWMIEGERLIHLPEVKAIYEGYPGSFGETLLGLASLKILGRERPIPCPSWSKEIKPDDGEGDQPREITKDVNTLRGFGAIGWRYLEEKNHGNHGTAGITWRGRSDIDMTVEVLEKCAEMVVPAMENLKHYQAWLERHPVRFIEATDRLQEPL